MAVYGLPASEIAEVIAHAVAQPASVDVGDLFGSGDTARASIQRCRVGSSPSSSQTPCSRAAAQ
ncbi:hypothetical protein GCM10010431_73380 [Streptomyces kunmingensis]